MFEEKTDYELFSQYLKNDEASASEVKAAKTALWVRYEPLTHKMGHILEARKVRSQFNGLNVETYYTDYYDAFEKAIEGIKMDKIKQDPSTWKFWKQYQGYLRSANRDKINAYCKKTKHECEITVTNDEGEEVFITDLAVNNPSAIAPSVEDSFSHCEESTILREVIKNAYTRFSDKQKAIWDMRSKSNTFTAIAKSMGVSSSSIKYQMNRIKDILVSELNYSNKKYHTRINVTCLSN